MNTVLQPRWRVVSAQFELSASRLDGCPPADMPEVAFAGRSNVGKSSLINALTGRRGLARTSKTPGRTQLLNFMRVQLHGPARSLEFRLVDLPGYGYARVGKKTRAGFDALMRDYIRERGGLRCLVLLVDARRCMDERDLELLSLTSERGVPALLVATKADKLGGAARGAVTAKVAAAVGARAQDVLLTSAHRRWGIEDSGRMGGLVGDLADLLTEAPP